MNIGERLRQLRESKNLSQRDVGKRTGLFNSYTSRIEHGRTVPSVEILEKYATALEIPLYRFFYEGKKPAPPRLPWKAGADSTWGMTAKEHRELLSFAKALSRMNDRQRRFFFAVAGFMARSKR